LEIAVAFEDQQVISPDAPVSVHQPHSVGLEQTFPEMGSAALPVLAAGVLTACGGGGGGSGGTPADPPTDADAARFLLQAQFSASDAEIVSVRNKGYAAWLQDEMSRTSSTSGWSWLNSRGYNVADDNRYFDQTYPANYMVWNQLMTSPDGVRRRVALALSEFFVVSMNSVDVSWRSHAMAHYWDTLCLNAFGNYRQLLEDITLNPAMGYFLNTKGNQKENSSGRVPDENYSREVLQLFSIGLHELKLDGTEKLDSSGQKIETYTQSDISNLARVFTGYDYDTSASPNVTVVLSSGTRTIPSNQELVRLPMKLNPALHSTLGASFLGTTIAPNTEGKAALKTALDTIANHPNVGPFFCKQMIQRLVTSNPSPSYVARVSTVFNNNGSGVRGDLRAVFAAILLDSEARSPSVTTQPLWGKLREPMVRLIQWGRTFGLRSIEGSWKLPDTSDAGTRLGQSPLRAPSVFNFFRPGYVPPATALATQQAVAPEFQIVNESSVGGYLNYARSFVRSGFAVQSPALPYNTGSTVLDLVADYSAELAIVADSTALVNRLNLLLCAGQLSSANQVLIRDALNTTPITSTSTPEKKLDQVAAAVLLVMASAEYLVQK
jgi:uncharacterized protein (DUF1800 family)